MRFDIDNYIEVVCDYIEVSDPGEDMICMFYVSFRDNPSLGLKILLQKANLGDAYAQFAFGYTIYYCKTEIEAAMWDCLGEAKDKADSLMKVVETDWHKWEEIGMQWWQKAAEQGNLNTIIDVSVHMRTIRCPLFKLDKLARE